MDMYERLEKVIRAVPSRHVLRPILKDNLSSVAFAAPQMFSFWAQEISENIAAHIPFPPQKEWQWKVFETWTEKHRSQVESVATSANTTKCKIKGS